MLVGGTYGYKGLSLKIEEVLQDENVSPTGLFQLDEHFKFTQIYIDKISLLLNTEFSAYSAKRICQFQFQQVFFFFTKGLSQYFKDKFERIFWRTKLQ